MSRGLQPLPPDEADMLAAEYALGVLDAADRAQAEARIAADPAFAAAVQDWAARLAPMDAHYPEVPAPNLLPQIEARLFGRPAKAAPWWQTRLFGAFAGALATAAFAVVVILSQPPVGPVFQGQPVARLAGAAAVVFTVAYDPQAQRLRVSRSGGPAAPEAQDYELWAIAPGRPPASLGIIGPEGLERPFEPAAGLLFAVSVEPRGGSPTGLPTGPVIATGFTDL